MLTRSSGSDWLGDQDAIHYMTKEAPQSIYELKNTVFHFPEMKKVVSTSVPSRRSVQGVRKGWSGVLERVRWLTEQDMHFAFALWPVVETRYPFFLSSFSPWIFLCKMVPVWVDCSVEEDGTLHRFRAHRTVIATGGYGRLL